MANANKETELLEAARLFGVLAEPARLKILQLLKDGSRCGRELAEDLNLTPATTCHHLEKLKLANLLSERRSGKHVYYSISRNDFTRAVEQSLAALDNRPKHRRNNKKRQRSAGAEQKPRN